MKLFAATLGTETNSFSPIPTGIAAFRETFYYPAGTHPDRPFHFTAPLWVARQRARESGWSLAEGLCAFAMPAGPTTRAAYEALRDELLADLKQALPVDVALLGLHGAMIADGYDDCEGDLLGRVRELVGPRAIIGAELDPHCHLSAAMMANADFLVCFKEYPHIDFLERGEELVDLCVRAARAEIRPVKAVFDCRMIAPLHTPVEPMRSFVDRLSALEGKDGVLHISIAHSFPWGDVPDMGAKILVTTDGDVDLAQRLAAQLGQELFSLRGQTAPHYLTIDEALDQALAVGRGPVVIADTADNAGGGAPSDSTFILRRLMARNIGDAAIAPVWDPVAVSFCFQVGVGAQLDLRLGGKTGPVSGDPLDLRVEVVSLVKDARQSFGAGETRMGDTARLRIVDGPGAGIEIIVNSERTQATGRELFEGLGLDPRGKRLVVVKSSQHFHAAFAPIAATVLYVGGPGAIANDLTGFPFRRIQRPKWPFDPNPFGD